MRAHVKVLLAAQAGEAVRARVTVERVSGSRVVFATACLSPAGEVLVDGQAVAMIPSGFRV